MSDYRKIRDLLTQVRRRQTGRRLAAVAAASLWTTLGVIALAALILGTVDSVTIHLAAWALIATLLLTLWLTRFILPVLRRRRHNATATLLQEHAPELRNDLTSALEFGDALQQHTKQPNTTIGSPTLMAAALARTAQTFAENAALLEQ